MSTHDQKIYYLKLRNKNECGNDDGEIRLSFSNDIQNVHITSDKFHNENVIFCKKNCL